MTTAFWACVGALAVLWPARLAGPLDGAPLDQPAEALIVGVLLVWVVLTDRSILDRWLTRTLIAALLVWKVGMGALLAQDGWCLRFTSPVPLYLDRVTVPHSWDVRADWQSTVPRCSAVMTEGYDELERFPAWFYNLPPMDVGMQASANDRPPNVTLSFALDGYVRPSRPGTFQLLAGEDVTTRVSIDDRDIPAADATRGVSLDAGTHRIVIRGDLVRSHWSLHPLWNGNDVWSEATATMSAPSALDNAMRPWGRIVPPAIIAVFIGLGLTSIVRRVRSPMTLAAAALLSVVASAAAASGRDAVMRLAPIAMLGALVVPIARRARNRTGFSLLVAWPFLAMVATMAIPQVGLFTWYSSGDDWWMFQRWAYRIFMQGYWLEGGQPTFWFQPLYRWIAGALHMVFGDSSVGELFFDAGAALMCALYAFHVTKVSAGFRWGLFAATLTVCLFTLGPGWYLVGRGLSEFASAGLICAAALCALRARHGAWRFAMLAGLLATLGYFTRLNNLPMALAVAAFALPIRIPVGDLFRPSAWWPLASREVALGVIGMVALGMWLFTWRTWYYTGHVDMFYGTTAALNSVWHSYDGPWQTAERVGSSVLMLLTLNDPPRFDVRAVPVLGGFAIAVLGAAQVRWFARLPLNAVVFCLAGIVGALVARGTAYPGRFSTHLIPVTVTIAVCAAAQVVRVLRRQTGWRLSTSSELG